MCNRRDTFKVFFTIFLSVISSRPLICRYDSVSETTERISIKFILRVPTSNFLWFSFYLKSSRHLRLLSYTQLRTSFIHFLLNGSSYQYLIYKTPYIMRSLCLWALTYKRLMWTADLMEKKLLLQRSRTAYHLILKNFLALQRFIIIPKNPSQYLALNTGIKSTHTHTQTLSLSRNLFLGYDAVWQWMIDYRRFGGP